MNNLCVPLTLHPLIEQLNWIVLPFHFWKNDSHGSFHHTAFDKKFNGLFNHIILERITIQWIVLLYHPWEKDQMGHFIIPSLIQQSIGMFNMYTISSHSVMIQWILPSETDYELFVIIVQKLTLLSIWNGNRLRNIEQ